MATYNDIKKLKIGDNVYNLYDSGGTVTGMTTTAGTHTAGAQTVTNGIITTNIPTKTSHLTNDSGFITTDSDKNVTSTALTASSTYYLTGSSTSTTTTGGLSKHASIRAYVTADNTTSGSAYITIGNTSPSGSVGAKQGYIRLYGTTAYYHQIQGYTGYPAANRTVYLPRYAGDMYLTCVNTTGQIGGATTAPVYVDSTGVIKNVTSIPYTLLSGTPAVTEVEIVRW